MGGIFCSYCMELRDFSDFGKHKTKKKTVLILTIKEFIFLTYESSARANQILLKYNYYFLLAERVDVISRTSQTNLR